MDDRGDGHGLIHGFDPKEASLFTKFVMAAGPYAREAIRFVSPDLFASTLYHNHCFLQHQPPQVRQQSQGHGRRFNYHQTPSLTRRNEICLNSLRPTVSSLVCPWRPTTRNQSVSPVASAASARGHLEPSQRSLLELDVGGESGWPPRGFQPKILGSLAPSLPSASPAHTSRAVVRHV